MTIAFVGLGANAGEPRAQLLAAFEDLAAMPRTRVLARSALYRSSPIGYAAQADFINAVAQLDTGLDPQPLLAGLRTIEDRHGRERSFPNAPRTLDLDLLLYGDERIDTPEFKVPHPRMHQRAFVLAPLVQIDPAAIIPGLGPARALLEACGDQGVARLDG